MTALEKAATVALEAPTAATLLQTAIEKGADVEAIEKLVGLMERLEDRQAAKAFHRALAAFQAACPPVPQTATANIVSQRGGASFSYSYAPLDVVAAHVRPLLRDHGFSFRWDSSVDEKMVTAVCILDHEQGHSERATFTAPVESNARMSGAQHHAAATTYAKRQALIQVLGITTTEPDPDGADLEPVDDHQVVVLEELWELLTATIDPEKVDRMRTRFFSAIAVRPRDDGAFYFSDVPAATFEAAKNMLERKVAAS